MKIIKFEDKHQELIYDISTTELLDKAYRAIFLFRKNIVKSYYWIKHQKEDTLLIELYESACSGNIRAIINFLYTLRGGEYDGWEIVNLQDADKDIKDFSK